MNCNIGRNFSQTYKNKMGKVSHLFQRRSIWKRKAHIWVWYQTLIFWKQMMSPHTWSSFFQSFTWHRLEGGEKVELHMPAATKEETNAVLF